LEIAYAASVDDRKAPRIAPIVMHDYVAQLDGLLGQDQSNANSFCWEMQGL
jgi:hypothetical protein